MSNDVVATFGVVVGLTAVPDQDVVPGLVRVVLERSAVVALEHMNLLLLLLLQLATLPLALSLARRIDRAVMEQLPGGSRADAARATGQVMSDTLVRSLTALCAMTLDLAPAAVDGPGLVPALTSLCQHTSSQGLDVTLAVDLDVDVGESALGLIYRVVR